MPVMTLQELQEKKFEKAVFGGYDMASVDDFLDALSADYEDLIKENAALKAKLKGLVDKIEEYRSVDDAMRKALLSAQNMANEYMENAKRESAQMLQSAKSAAQEKLSSLAQEVAQEEARLAAAKRRTAEFLDKASALFQSAGQAVEGIRSEVLPAAENETSQHSSVRDAQPASAAEAADEAEVKIELPEVPVSGAQDAQESTIDLAESMENLHFDEDAPPPPQYDVADDGMRYKVFEVNLGAQQEAPKEERGRAGKRRRDKAEEEDEEDTFTPKPKFNFDNLRFGRDYDEEN